MTRTSAQTRTYAHQNTTDWNKARRIMKRRIKKFLNRHMVKMILFGLPLVGMIIGILIGVKITTYAQSTKLNDYGRQISYVAYTVKSGDSVWEIASDLAALNPEYNDIRQYVAAIEKANNLYGSKLKAGEIILIPYYTSTSGMNYNEIYSKYGIGK